MKITLIHPPWLFGKERFLEQKNLSQCLGLGYIASYLKTRGHQVIFIDALAEGLGSLKAFSTGSQDLIYQGLSYGDIIKKIPADTQLIGVSVPFSNLREVVKQLCVKIKESFPSVSIVAGGVHPSALPQDLLIGDIDYVVRGEGEIPMAQLADGMAPRDIKGMVFKINGDIVDNGPAEQIEELDKIPFPYKPAELMDRYLSYSPRGQEDRRTLSIITSRSCPYDCSFCSVHPVSGYHWRARSPDNVMDEIVYYVDNHGVNHIEFEDDNLTLDAARAEKIFDGIISMDKKIGWAVNNGLRVDTLSRGLIKKMKMSGCIQINLAIESGNDKVLGLMNKKLSLDRVEEVVRACAEFKIPTLGFFLVGYPGETKQTFADTLRCVKKLKKIGLGRIGAMIVNAYPGTKLYGYSKEKGYLMPGVDNHIFVGDDYVSITTEDFDKELVLYWRGLLEGIFHPLRWRLKQAVKIILPESIFNRLLSFYKRWRDSRRGGPNG